MKSIRNRPILNAQRIKGDVRGGKNAGGGEAIRHHKNVGMSQVQTEMYCFRYLFLEMKLPYVGSKPFVDTVLL